MTLALVHFRAVDLRYFEAALYSILWQRNLREHVSELLVLDNDTETPTNELDDRLAFARAILQPIPVRLVSLKHGDPDKRCQSWSVNEVFRQASLDPWVLFTRTDYILDRHLVEKFAWELQQRHGMGSIGKDFVLIPPDPWRGFITSYAYHMAYDERGDQRIVGMRDLEPTRWKIEGAQVLLEWVNGWKVDSSDKDAGVWLTRKDLWEEVGGLNEQLRAWGYQQTVWQWRLKNAGVEMVQIPEFLYFHQHHGGDFRSYDVARAELRAIGLSEEDLKDFRDVTGLTGAVCDELDEEAP